MKKLLVSVIALFGAVSLSAQDVTAIYNEAAAAFGAKNFTEAAAKFEQVIDQGMDNESAASMVATAKSTLPKCYFMLGGGALKTKNYDEALKNFEKSAELAELYGDMNQMAKSNGWVAKIYQIQGATLSTIRTMPPRRRSSPRAMPPTPTTRAWRSTWR